MLAGWIFCPAFFMQSFLDSLVEIPVGVGGFLLDFFDRIQGLGWLGELVLMAVPFLTLFVLNISFDLLFCIKKKF